MKMSKKKKKSFSEKLRANSFQEGLHSICLSNWIRKNDPETYNRMLEKGEVSYG